MVNPGFKPTESDSRTHSIISYAERALRDGGKGHDSYIHRTTDITRATREARDMCDHQL